MYACGAARIDHACDLSHMHVEQLVLIDRVVSFASAAYVRTSLSWSDRLYACVRQQQCFFPVDRAGSADHPTGAATANSIGAKIMQTTYEHTLTNG